MARPTTIRDEDILAAAREVFLEKGISATTAEVAERAGVSEGTLFNRFKTKYDLFKAAMVEDGEPAWIRKLAESVGKRDVQEALAESALAAIGFFRERLPLMMMAWSNQGMTGELPEGLRQPNPPPLRALKALTGYFEAEMRAGRLRRHDPEICARMFSGSLMQYAFLEVVLAAHDELPLPAETFVRGLVHLIWTGAAPVGKAG
jgi:AcrR family transcriptional regulator